MRAWARSAHAALWACAARARARGDRFNEAMQLNPRATAQGLPKRARRVAARTGTAVGGCAQHTRPRGPLVDLALALPGAQDMNACYAKRRAGAALACEHAFRSLQLRKRRDSPAVCVTQRYVKSAARPTYPRTDNAQRAAQQGADRLVLPIRSRRDSERRLLLFVSDRDDVRRSDAASA